jgi:high affinity Mn2+ porin
VRQTINSGGAGEEIEGLADQLAGSHSRDRWVITLGKFSVTDVFDTNQYAHDPRTDFLNWALLDTGSFDYAADAWGYTVGIAVERYIGAWTFRAGVFDMSDVPNSKSLEPGFHEFQLDGEIERPLEGCDHTAGLAKELIPLLIPVLYVNQRSGGWLPSNFARYVPRMKLEA